MSVHDLDDLFTKLDLHATARGQNDDAIPFTSQHLAFSSWKRKPTQVHLSPTLDAKQLRDILDEDLEVDSDPSGIAQLKTPIPARISFQPFQQHVDPEAKPNLLVLLSTILHRCLKQQQHQTETSVTVDNLIATLEKYDVLMPRNPLKKVLAATQSPGESWEVYAMRPSKDGPLFVERTKSYPTNPGAIGMLFEKEVTTQPLAGSKYHRVYAVRVGRFGNLTVALTGEVDCVDPTDSTVVEIKSKPEWARRDETREVESWIQCKLAGVETIVTGGFSATRGVRNGPVTFHKRNISTQTVDAFGASFHAKSKRAFEYGQKTLKEMVDGCDKVGQVYHITGQYGRKASIREARENEMGFPISQQLIKELATVMTTAEE